MHGKTDVGSVRDHNEDAIGCDENIGLAVLADGMGGHRGGEMASAITVSTILETVSEKIKKIKAGETDEETGYSLESLAVHEAVALANKNVHDSSEANAQYRGMGTTVVVVTVSMMIVSPWHMSVILVSIACATWNSNRSRVTTA